MAQNKKQPMAVPQEIEKPFANLIGAKAVGEIVKARVEAEQTLVEEKMLGAFAENLHKQGRCPANPKLEMKKDNKADLQGIFQVQDRYTIEIPLGDTPIEDRIEEALIAAGLTADKAEKIVSKEVDCTPSTTIRPLNELVNGHYVEKEWVEATEAERQAGKKLLDFVLGNATEPLTAEEKELVIKHEEAKKVKAGFLERLPVYCDSVEEIKSVLAVIKPVHFVSHCKFAVSDTPENRQSRLITEASRILGVAA